MPHFFVPPIKAPSRDGGNSRGDDGLDQILKAAEKVLVENGYKAMTMRRIASECGMMSGNISYYFKSKDDLLRTLLDAIMVSYEEAFTLAINEGGASPDKRLVNLISMIAEDIGTKRTTRIFPELWALSAHDEFVAERLYDMYQRQYRYFDELILAVNPGLGPERTRELSAFITASLEGLTVFCGYQKPWADQLPRFTEYMANSFLYTVKSASTPVGSMPSKIEAT
ncbi:TetR/AcrR family transcriptional regulator [Paracoccus versutus]|uniref:TetR family transcriptional regulator n=1 Tax=Paracoccus versutus TaxID=34007 RepID=A0A3D9XUS2_PARVE|nr:TetR/AcrR family transcriptional regulator [Paracoccus versutus]REF73388.1 TetR family transcriptional regulator [Paracoccus versutus]WGR54592.1 TetR/AcrR family transcriptional regulator [Paracoccus versutus]